MMASIAYRTRKDDTGDSLISRLDIRRVISIITESLDAIHDRFAAAGMLAVKYKSASSYEHQLWREFYDFTAI